MNNKNKYRLLVISHVKPFPGFSGQQNRVKNILLALKENFSVTFLTFERKENLKDTVDRISDLVDEVIVLPSIAGKNILSRIYHRIRGWVHNLRKGLKYSNYLIGEVELAPRRIIEAIKGKSFEAAIFEYWHAHRNVAQLKNLNLTCILDMHDILWRTYALSLKSRRNPFQRWRRKRLVKCYQGTEESAWRDFDGLIAISQSEAEYVKDKVSGAEVFTAFMGLNPVKWNYRWEPATPVRFAYYGNMSGKANINAARRCAERIMPLVWDHLPKSEFWIVGGNPTPEIRNLGENPRIIVTGFVDNVADTLSSMTAIICPWEAEFGFRSRLIEAMALGCPIIATPEAVAGMDLEVGKGVLTADSDAELAQICLKLAQNPSETAEQSKSARRQVEVKYTFEATYGKLAGELYSFISRNKNSGLAD